MVSQDVPRNVSQRAGKLLSFSVRVTTQSTTIYQVPAGKIARITKPSYVVDAFGSGSRGGIGFRDSSSGLALKQLTLASKEVNLVVYGSDITLDAGDQVSSWQNSGTNITIYINFTVEEFPA